MKGKTILMDELYKLSAKDERRGGSGRADDGGIVYRYISFFLSFLFIYLFIFLFFLFRYPFYTLERCHK